MVMLIFRWVDEMGNVHGRVEGANADAGALLIGSHLVMHSHPQKLAYLKTESLPSK